MKTIILFAVIFALGAIPIVAATDNASVSVNVNIVEVCILELNYSAGATSFVIEDSTLRGLEPGNPLSYKTVNPNDPAGVAVTIYSNSRNGTKLEIGAASNFAIKSPGNSEIIPIEQLKWTSVRGNKSGINMGLVPTSCFTTSSEGIVTDNIKYSLDIFSFDAFGQYETVITYTAINN